MKKNKIRILTILLILVFTGIVSFKMINFNSSINLNHKEYVEYIKSENDLKIKKEISDYNYILTLEPGNYNAIKNLSLNADIEVKKKAILESDEFIYFNLKVKSLDKGNPVLDPSKLDIQEYNNRLHYYHAIAQNDIKLIVDNDSLKCLNYLFENPYNLSDEVNMLLAFNVSTKNLKSDLQLVYNDRLFNNGLIKFLYKKQTINNLPKLKI